MRAGHNPTRIDSDIRHRICSLSHDVLPILLPAGRGAKFGPHPVAPSKPPCSRCLDGSGGLRDGLRRECELAHTALKKPTNRNAIVHVSLEIPSTNAQSKAPMRRLLLGFQLSSAV
jgi:hypothetical protein